VFEEISMFVTWILAAIRSALALRAPSQALQALDDRLLADIGISRGEIEPAVRGKL
jgi:uncharacterized protein YjiS (DUF1127 family)